MSLRSAKQLNRGGDHRCNMLSEISKQNMWSSEKSVLCMLTLENLHRPNWTVRGLVRYYSTWTKPFWAKCKPTSWQHGFWQKQHWISLAARRNSALHNHGRHINCVDSPSLAISRVLQPSIRRSLRSAQRASKRSVWPCKCNDSILVCLLRDCAAATIIAFSSSSPSIWC